MSLSKRLTAICRMVPAGCVPADIGTDHAAVPIELVRSGKCSRALACDVLEGPLSAARVNIARAGLKGRIGTYLSDGFGALPEGAFDTAVICGMGGQTIRRILEGRPAEGLKTFILSPQSEQEELRAYLRGEGLRITAEDLVLEDGKFYPVILAEERRGAEPAPGEADEAAAMFQRVLDRYGPCLIAEAHPLLPAYLERRERVLAQIEAGLAKADGPRAEEKRSEIDTERRMAETALDLWNRKNDRRDA